MLDLVVFYLFALSFILHFYNSKIGSVLLIITAILTVTDGLALFFGEHICFFDLFRLNDDMVSLSLVVMPVHMLLTAVFVLVNLVLAVMVWKQRIARVSAILTVMFGFLLLNYNQAVYAYGDVLYSSIKYLYYCTLDKEVIEKKLKVSNNNIGTTCVPANPQNIVIIYCESFEDTIMECDNYTLMKEINDLYKREKLYRYTNYKMLPGSDATINAIFSTQTSLPLLIRGRCGKARDLLNVAKSKNSVAKFLSSIGYNNVFVSASRLDFFGADAIITDLGYNIVQAENMLGENPSHEWGYNDRYTFDLAKKEFLKLSNELKPFNMNILTVDTHFPKGLPDYTLKSKLGARANLDSHLYSYASLSYLLYDFVHFLEQQPNYKDTVVLIIGDHLLMGDVHLTPLVDKLSDKPRRIALMSNRKIPCFKYDQEIAFYDIPNIILSLLDVTNGPKFGKDLIPAYSKQYILDNKELLMAYISKMQ